ncbi:hypothetical protein BY996DRAFT_6417740 [Phakopsora pachyrhizi]|nr:hypothetical protein BY996DRAFT_6417740 [Phakopsora pachyrhizi]
MIKLYDTLTPAVKPEDVELLIRLSKEKVPSLPREEERHPDRISKEIKTQDYYSKDEYHKVNSLNDLSTTKDDNISRTLASQSQPHDEDEILVDPNHILDNAIRAEFQKRLSEGPFIASKNWGKIHFIEATALVAKYVSQNNLKMKSQPKIMGAASSHLPRDHDTKIIPKSKSVFYQIPAFYLLRDLLKGLKKSKTIKDEPFFLPIHELNRDPVTKKLIFYLNQKALNAFNFFMKYSEMEYILGFVKDLQSDDELIKMINDHTVKATNCAFYELGLHKDLNDFVSLFENLQSRLPFGHAFSKWYMHGYNLARQPEIFKRLICGIPDKNAHQQAKTMILFFDFKLNPPKDSQTHISAECLYFLIYYVLDYLINEKSSRFYLTYREDIEMRYLKTKITLLKRHISLSLKASEMRKSWTTAKRNYFEELSPIEISERLKDKNLQDWFDERWSHSKALEEEISEYLSEIYEKKQQARKRKFLAEENIVGEWLDNPRIKDKFDFLEESKKILERHRTKQSKRIIDLGGRVQLET